MLSVLVLASLSLTAQDSIRKKERPPFDRKEEIIHNGKRYRIYNNYLTLGGGFGGSSIRSGSQRNAGIDFHFHIRRLYFQAGAMLSGNDFFSNNHTQGHFGAGYRKEGRHTNFAVFGGPCYFSGVEGEPPAPPRFYEGVGAYVCVQAVSKMMYDIGLGVDLITEFNYRQSLYGLRIIVFFSGAYQGLKRNFNPNVRSENPR
jgi:hypothetical protein